MRSLIILIVIMTTFVVAPFVRAADPTPSPTPEASASPAKKHSRKPKRPQLPHPPQL